jgi:heptosyltransferase III
MPVSGEADVRIGLPGTDIDSAERFLKGQGRRHKGKILVGFGPGSKMQAKKWPIQRYYEVGKRLIKGYDVWPVIFGGHEDKVIGDELLTMWNRGYNAAGQLGLREAAAGLSKCKLYIGNDTGTMHLAASVSTSCVAIFSARDLKGKWYPYGKGHMVFRKDVSCAGCQYETCDHNTCLIEIHVEDVVETAESKLEALS